MQYENKIHENRKLNLILGKQKVQRLKKLNILVVGVGGIGCQVLKNLSKLPIHSVTIIDLDTIQLSNLNRQFYFRKQHINQSKSKVAAQQFLEFVPDFKIQSIQGSIYDKKYDNYNFYSKFDLIISALDNYKARQHVAKNATKYGKVLIDAGTAGFNGQAYSSIRFKTSCHNCYPTVPQENFAVCTIRVRPQKSIHCAVYAKNLYQQFFGNQSDDFLHKQIRQIKQKVQQSLPNFNQEKLTNLAIQLFNYLFNHQLKHLQKNQFQPLGNLSFLSYKQSIISQKQLDCEKVQNDKYQTIWSLKQYTESFIRSFLRLVKRKCDQSSSDSPIKNQYEFHQFYQKDDFDCALFVYTVTTLRTLNFKSFNGQKLKLITFEECRKTLGKIIPAIASTNSIAASLQIDLIMDYLSDCPAKYLSISPWSEQKVSYSWLSLPSSQCSVCSPINLYFQIQCCFNTTTYEQFQSFAFQNCHSENRDVYCQNLVLIKNCKAGKVSANKSKLLNFKADLIVQNTLSLTFLPKSNVSELKIQVTLIDIDSNVTVRDKINENKFRVVNSKQIQRTNQMYEQYKLTKASLDYIIGQTHETTHKE